MSGRFLLFALVGATAFAVDAGAYLLLGSWFDHPPLQKSLGFFGGVSTTYLLNSFITFCTPLALSRFGLYVLSQGVGIVVNLTFFLFFLCLCLLLGPCCWPRWQGLDLTFLQPNKSCADLHRPAE